MPPFSCINVSLAGKLYGHTDIENNRAGQGGEGMLVQVWGGDYQFVMVSQERCHHSSVL